MSDINNQGAEPREDGWIEWTGGENPVPGARVECRGRYGSSWSETEADKLRWAHVGRPSDIIAYRVVSPAPAAPTNGGGGREVTWVNDASNVNDRRMYVDGHQWAKVYGWDQASLNARCDVLQAALQPQPTQQGGAEDPESDGPPVIWLQPSCCVEPIDGRQWSEDQWAWEECEGHAQQGPTRYVRAPEYAEIRDALAWYGEQARLARLIHSEGDAGRNALAADGGKRALAALKTEKA